MSISSSIRVPVNFTNSEANKPITKILNIKNKRSHLSNDSLAVHNSFLIWLIFAIQFIKRYPMKFRSDFHFSFDNGPENLPTSATFGPDTMATKLYQHCEKEDLELAKMLVKPSGLFLEDLAKESLLTKEKFGSVNRVYIVCENDELLKEEFQRWFIENSPTKDVKSIAGADHMVMLSKPKELFQCLQETADCYNSVC